MLCPMCGEDDETPDIEGLGSILCTLCSLDQFGVEQADQQELLEAIREDLKDGETFTGPASGRGFERMASTGGVYDADWFGESAEAEEEED